MKALKIFIFGLILLVLLLLVVALFVSKDFAYEKSITINAPVDSVWVNTNSLAALDKWNPWNDQEPDMKKELSGIDGTIGAKQSWDGKIVGRGSQTIVKIEKPTLFETELVFYEPNESHGKGFVKLVAEGTRTKVTWGMTGNMPYPFNIMNLFMDMEKSMGQDWNKGLTKLRNLSEN